MRLSLALLFVLSGAPVASAQWSVETADCRDHALCSVGTTCTTLDYDVASDDEGVATASFSAPDLTVCGVAEGTATVTVDACVAGTARCFERQFTVTVTEPPATPPATGDLALWLEADNGVSTSGGTVTGWADQSGGGHDLTAAGNPTLTTTPTSEPAIACDGTGDFLSRTATLTGFPSSSASRSMYVLTRYDGLGYAGTAYGPTGTPSCGTVFGLGVENDGDLFVQRWCSDFSTTVDGTGEGWMLHSVNVDGSDLRHYVDGAEIATGTAGGGQALATSVDKFATCGEIDGSPTLDQDVAAILLYDRSLTTGERYDVHSYLMEKYLGTVAPPITPTFADAAVTDLDKAESFGMADLDGDGAEEIVSALAGIHVGGQEEFFWCSDDGSSLTCHAVNATWWAATVGAGALPNFAGSLRMGDLDDDGDLDIVIGLDRHTGFGEGWIYWLENPHVGTGDMTDDWTPHLVWNFSDEGTDALQVDHINDLALADYDDDGLLDIAARHLDRTGTYDLGNAVRVLYQDDAAADDWTLKTISVQDSEGLASGDLDGDGWPDLVLNGFWLENPDGSRTASWTRHDVASWAYSQSGGSEWNNATKESVADLNGDTFLDILWSRAEGDAGSGGTEGKLAIYLNDGTPLNGGWTEVVLESAWTNAHQAELGDVDGDGQLDVMTGKAFGAGGIWVWYLETDGTLREKVQIEASNGCYTCRLGDTDGDGDLDVAGPTTYANQVYHYRNARY